MDTTFLERLEEDISKLSVSEQIWLIERLAHRLRERTLQETPPQAHLEAMASDPDIQRELHLIEREFAGTQNDGLEAEL